MNSHTSDMRVHSRKSIQLSSKETTAPHVAVLLCVYHADDIPQFRLAMESLIAQTYPEDKIHIYLCLDGKAGEELLETIFSYSNHIHRFLINNTNIGLANSLNRLIESLEDEKYAFRMDADDICDPMRFIRQVEFMESNPSLMVSGCSCYEIDQHGKVLRARDFPETNDDIRRLITRFQPLLHPTLCFRTQLFQDPRMRYRNVYLTEDLDFFFRIAASGHEMGNYNERLFQWRITPQFYGRRRGKRILAEFKTYVKGIWHLHGPTWRLVYPAVRLAFRIMPTQLVATIYNSPLRLRLVGSSHTIEQSSASTGRALASTAHE